MPGKRLTQLFITGIFVFLAGCTTTVPEPGFIKPKPPQTVAPGIEVLKQQNFAPLEGYRVGLVTNATGVDHNLRSTADLLYEAPNVNLVALFAPEHGVRGELAAGEYAEFYIDSHTNLPVYSLYGRTRRPTPEMLKDIDLLVYDIQDIGCRSYTYISTMGLCMEECARQGIKVLVLDRPNPLGGNRVEGSLVRDGFFSFVSQFPIPYVYGLTPGELALLLNGEGLLNGGVQCDLEVVALQNWWRAMTYEDTGLEWVPTSPHVPHKYSPLYYVSSGVMGELSIISEGVGYTAPFQLIGADWVDGDDMAAELNALQLPGVIFRPVLYKPFYGRDEGTNIGGVQIHLIEPALVDLLGIQFRVLEALIKLYPDKNPFDMAAPDRLRMFDQVTGDSKVRELFCKNYHYADVEPFFNEGADAFRELSQKYYLYK